MKLQQSILLTILLLTFVCVQNALHAQPQLSIQKLDRGKTLQVIPGTDSQASGCTVELRASKSRRKLSSQPGEQELLATVIASPTGNLLTALDVPRVKKRRSQRKRRVPFFFRLRQTCGDTISLSEIEKVSFKTGRGKKLPKRRVWLSQLGELLTDLSIRSENAFPQVTFELPVDLRSPPDGSDRIFVVEQPGKIHVLPNSRDTAGSEIFLNLESRVLFNRTGDERGLLGLVFHPDYGTNGFFFVHYSEDGTGDSLISRFKASSENSNVADPDSETVLIRVPQPSVVHQGGGLAFGPDGFLYISLGDGGGQEDPSNNGQSLNTLLGSILRIDVDSTEGSLSYAIPESNPYKGNSDGYREEIYAHGFRNPWRISFDSLTGDLWVGDVGQSTWEEINLIEAGKNYGWRKMEGPECFPIGSDCSTDGLEPPVLAIQHPTSVSITAGHVYRGDSISSLAGKLLFADFNTGQIWTLDNSGDEVTTLELFNTSHFISSFGVDQSGEVYFLSYIDGTVHRLVQNSLPE